MMHKFNNLLPRVLFVICLDHLSARSINASFPLGPRVYSSHGAKEPCFNNASEIFHNMQRYIPKYAYY